ncbi:S9 family peptidase [Sphingomonas sp. R647]|uniref:S9 family peptidase n=1 Tax=Sphingomonas sp. R647 TaxID=2875233 RepID=UPI001CD1A591|nr:S9 family peptidase [Sphingomonas sp. R647]MCA1197279.1 S9 family peptidase [Sphingomonas sp. R647]
MTRTPLILRLFFASVAMTVPTALIAQQPAPALPQTGPVPMGAVDFVALPQLGKPSLSPDGGKLIYVRSQVDWVKNKHRDDYMLLDLATGQAQRMSDWVHEDDSLSMVNWSPDSTSVAFTMKGKGDKRDQIYLYDIKARSVAKLTAHKTGVTDLNWSPDGRAIYFRARRPDPASTRVRKFQITPFDTDLPYELWRHDRKDGKSHRVLGGDISIDDYSLSRDGTKILLTIVPDGPQYGSTEREIWLHDIAGGSTQRLTRNRYAEVRAQLAPDNKSFAYIATVNQAGDTYYEDNLFVHRIGEAEPRLMLADVPMEVGDFAWGDTGNTITLLANIGLRSELFRVTVSANRAERLTRGDHSLSEWRYDPQSKAHVAVITDAASPGEIAVMRSGDTAMRRVTRDYADLPKRFRLPRQEAFSWKGRDGQPLEGLIIYPVDYRPGTRFPLITITHGGPRSSSQFGSWNLSRAVPVFTGQGYGIFLPNHRGGTGYGDAFMRDMVGKYFNNAHLDVLDGVDALVAKGLADPDRLAATGWSAGGHMTNKLITITDRFKAASSGAGGADWISLYGESDVRDYRAAWFGGSPWQENAPLANFVEQSLLKDAWRVKTPTLFFGGSKDVRVPPTQAILMYRGVRTAGAPTRLYLAEGEPHNFKKPSNQLFKINAELEWFGRYVTGTPYRAVLPELPASSAKPKAR